jgi:O-antigen/teichoic acid export membrane protein
MDESSPAEPVAEIRLGGLGRGITWTVAGLLGNGLGAVAVTGVAARHLGATPFGVFAVAAAVLGILTAVDFGLGLTVVKEVASATTLSPERAREPHHRAHTAHSAYVAVGAAITLVGAALAFYAPLWLPVRGVAPTSEREMLILVAIAAGLALGTSALSGVALGCRQFRVMTAAGIAGSAVALILVVTLISRWGLAALGVAEVGGVATTAVVLGWWVHRRQPWFRFQPTTPTWADLRPIVAFTAPLLVLALSVQVVAATDLIVVGAVTTAASVGLYKIGSLLPTQLSAALISAYDTAFPWLTATSDPREREAATLLLSRLSGYVSGLGFATLAWCRADVVDLLLGHSSALASTVLLVFCGVWVINATVHGLAVLLIANGRPQVLGRLVSLETVVNAVLTVALVIAVGAVGAALGTLITVAVSNLVIFPLLARRYLSVPVHQHVLAGSLPAAVFGAAVASAVGAPFSLMHWSGPGHLVGAGVIAAGVGAAVGAAAIGSRGRQALRSAASRPPADV